MRPDGVVQVLENAFLFGLRKAFNHGQALEEPGTEPDWNRHRERRRVSQQFVRRYLESKTEPEDHLVIHPELAGLVVGDEALSDSDDFAQSPLGQSSLLPEVGDPLTESLDVVEGKRPKVGLGWARHDPYNIHKIRFDTLEKSRLGQKLLFLKGKWAVSTGSTRQYRPALSDGKSETLSDGIIPTSKEDKV